MDALCELNNLWMLSGFIRQYRQVLFQKVQGSMGYQKIPDLTEICRFGKDTMLSRMFQVMEKFHVNEWMAAEDTDYTTVIRRIKAYAATKSKGKIIPQIVLQENWVEQCGFEAGCNVMIESYPNKLVVLKE